MRARRGERQAEWRKNRKIFAKWSRMPEPGGKSKKRISRRAELRRKPNEPERAITRPNAKNRKVFEMRLQGLCEQQIQEAERAQELTSIVWKHEYYKISCIINVRFTISKILNRQSRLLTCLTYFRHYPNLFFAQSRLLICFNWF